MTRLAILASVAAGALMFAGAKQATAAVIHTEQGFTFNLRPAIAGYYFVNSVPNYVAYCPACFGTPVVLSLTDGNTPFDLLSLKIAGFEPVSLKVKVENATGKVLDTIAVTNAGGSSGDPSGFASTPVDTGLVKQINFVPVAKGTDRTDCVCISDLVVEVGGKTLTLFDNPVSEPMSASLLLAGVLGLGVWRQRHPRT